jgi:opacity protein-like surface antigen
MRASFVFAVVSAAALAAAANADVVAGPVSVSTDMGQEWLSINNTINQSGLNSSYVSGVTDFAAFTASTTHSSGYYSTWLSGAGATTGNIDFDMGSMMTLNGLALWANGQPAGLVSEYLHNFQVYTSSDAAFTAPVLVGSFTLSTAPGNDNDPAHVFNFASNVDTQYIRIRVLDTQVGVNWTTAVDEVVFSQVVPAPGTAALLSGLGLVASRRRRA